MTLSLPDLDAIGGEQIMLSRIALLERRVQMLSDLCVARLGREECANAWPDRVAIEADSEPELAGGFYLREWNERGEPFRWAGRGDTFEFRFLVDRAAARPFAMSGLIADGVDRDSISAFVDYRPVPIRLAADGRMVDIGGIIPADPMNAMTTLTFACPCVASPNPADTRRLSFAFRRLDVGRMDVGRMGVEQIETPIADNVTRLRLRA